MHREREEPQLAVLTATLKVLARWAPHARHDVLGACSPITLDLLVLDLKSKKGALSNDELNPIIERAKANVKNTVQQLDRMVLLQRQDRSRESGVVEILERMVHSVRTVFAGVQWSAPNDATVFGSDSEYDLTVTIWAVLMALFDQHGASMTLFMAAHREHGRLGVDFSVTPLVDAAWAGTNSSIPPEQRISINEVRHLANHLGFALLERERGIEIRRGVGDFVTVNK